MSDPPPSQTTGRGQSLSAYLERRTARDGAQEPLKASSPSRPVSLERAEELAAAAVGLLVLERVAVHAGTRVPVRTLRELRERLTEPFNSREVMEMEVEAYDVLSWLVGLDPAPEPPSEAPRVAQSELVAYDPDMPVLDLLRRAVAEEFDVEIQYYTQSRGELTRRRVTPTHIQAETYLHAYCHTRREERVFRISRIAEIKPVDGRAVPSRRGEGGPSQGHLEL